MLKAEEERFYETLENGMEILDAALAGGQKVLPGDVAFKLHDTYGFPLDLSADVCRERGLSVDEAGFHAAMDKQKAAGRAAGKFKMDRALEYSGAGNRLRRLREAGGTGARSWRCTSTARPSRKLKAGQHGVVVLDTTPFYAESGGQVGDEGVLVAGSAQFPGGRHAEDQGRRLRPPRHPDARHAQRRRPRDGARSTWPSAPRPCATTASRT